MKVYRVIKDPPHPASHCLGIDWADRAPIMEAQPLNEPATTRPKRGVARRPIRRQATLIGALWNHGTKQKVIARDFRVSVSRVQQVIDRSSKFLTHPESAPAWAAAMLRIIVASHQMHDTPSADSFTAGNLIRVDGELAAGAWSLGWEVQAAWRGDDGLHVVVQVPDFDFDVAEMYMASLILPSVIAATHSGPVQHVRVVHTDLEWSEKWLRHWGLYNDDGLSLPRLPALESLPHLSFSGNPVMQGWSVERQEYVVPAVAVDALCAVRGLKTLHGGGVGRLDLLVASPRRVLLQKKARRVFLEAIEQYSLLAPDGTSLADFLDREMPPKTPVHVEDATPRARARKPERVEPGWVWIPRGEPGGPGWV